MRTENEILETLKEVARDCSQEEEGERKHLLQAIQSSLGWVLELPGVGDKLLAPYSRKS